ncbi:MAG: hypothetical protein AAFU51_15185 [Bacteroidota bacterium]
MPTSSNSTRRSALGSRLSALGARCWVAALVLWVGCSGGIDGIIVDLDKANEDVLLAFYFGSYVGPGGGDPLEAGLLGREGNAVTLNMDALPAPTRGAFASAAEDGRIDWDEAKAAFQATYAEARAVPASLSDFQSAVPYLDASGRAADGWYSVEIDGVMTSARRRVYVEKGALRQALRDFDANGERIVYPPGTALIGEHWLDGERAEVTIKQKRADGFWDFLVYDAAGTLADGTSTPPRDLAAPTQCVGCHLGTKLHEPEKSFPAEAPDGPHGPRAIYIDEATRDAEETRAVTERFAEHRTRSDSVLGLYATLFVADLLADRRAGRALDAEDEATLAALGY